MLQLIEFIGNHWLLSGAFTATLILLITNELKRGGRSISCQELVHLMNREKAVVIDLRPAKEFSQGHIQGAINIPYTQFQDRISDLEKHRQKPIVLTCKLGQHSGGAGNSLRKAGFLNISRLSGGLNNWQLSNLPVVKS